MSNGAENRNLKKLEEENRLLKLQLENLTKESAIETVQLLHHAPQIMLLVNDSYEVEHINRFYSNTEADKADEVEGGLRAGDVLRCVNALENPKGCGFFHHCKQCVISNSIKSTLKDEKGVTGIYTELPTLSNGIESKRFIQLSTSFLTHDAKPQVAVYINDITDLSTTQQALRESEERFELAVMGTSDGIWDWDLRNNRLYLSPNWKAMLGYQMDELEHHISTWENLVHPNDKEKTLKIVADFIENRIPKYQCEFRLRHKNGHYIEVLSRGVKQVDKETGKAFRLIGTHVDLSTLREQEFKIRESEERYQSMVTAMSEGVVVQNMYGQITYANRATENILGLTMEQLQGKMSIDPSWRSVHEDMTPFPGEDHPAMVTLRTGLPQHNVTMGVHKPNGELSWIKVNSEPIFIESRKKPTGVVATFTDITEERNALNELEVSNKMKDRFFSILSHDLKIPFNALLGFSQLLKESVEEMDVDSIKTYSKYIHDASQRNFNLLMNLLDWSRSQSGNIKFRPELVDINELINDCKEFLIDALASKNITVVVNMKYKKQIWADKNMLNTVLRNLISNAMKYSYDYGIIEVEVQNKKDAILFSVRDYGVGIKEKYVSTLFKADSNYRTAGTKEEEGTGLGLVLCKELVEKHMGEIWVESVYNEGTTFYFTIPRHI